MMHPPDLYSRTGMSTSLHFALSLGLRSLLDLHHTEEQLSSTDSFAQANSCAKSCANALRSSTGVVGAPSWGEAPGKPVPPVLPPVDLVGMGVGAGAGAAAAGSGRRALSSRSLASSSANLHRIVHRIVHCIVHVHGVRSTRCTVPCMPAACAVGLLY